MAKKTRVKYNRLLVLQVIELTQQAVLLGLRFDLDSNGRGAQWGLHGAGFGRRWFEEQNDLRYFMEGMRAAQKMAKGEAA